MKMDKAKQHWEILQGLGTDLANKVRQFMVIGYDGEGLLVATDDGQGYWLGEIEILSSESTEPTPLDVPELTQMAQGEHHILLLNKRGEIYSMGSNNYGQLGLGTVDYKTYFPPQRISIIPQHKFISVRCGGGHSVALTEDGKCWAWGDNNFGQVGLSSSTAKRFPSPRQIPELNFYRIVAVECGGHHSLALTDRGEVFAWGWNENGQTGNRSRSSENLPKRIPTPSPVQSIAAGYLHTLLLSQTGVVYSCGDNRCRQLGFFTSTEFSFCLSKVEGLPPISQIACHPASNLSIAMSADKRCFVWGQLDNGNLDEQDIKISTPLKLSSIYSTIESPLSSFSTHRYTPNSVTIPETPPSLSARMSRMFDNPETSPDVQFVVEQRTIHAHRIILSNSSDYFARMFSERWLAPVDPEDPIVKVIIPDHSYQEFHAFLRFIYTDSLEVHPNLLPKLFELATQYLVSCLQKLCISRMRTTLTPTTCCLYYPLTHRHSLLPELATFQQELVQFASTRMWEVVDSAAYQSMEPDLRDILNNTVQYFPGT